MTSDREDDLRTTADELVADAERMKEIERQKAELDVDDPRFQELSAESRRIAERLGVEAEAEEALAQEAAREPEDDASA